MYTTKVELPTHGLGSGAVFDPGCTAVEQRTRRRRQKTLLARSKRLALSEAGSTQGGQSPETNGGGSGALATLGKDTMIDGVRIPANLSGVPAANFILTQAPGKMKPKDLAAAIAQQNAQRAKQKAAQEQLRATLAAGDPSAATGGAAAGVAVRVVRFRGRGR